MTGIHPGQLLTQVVQPTLTALTDEIPPTETAARLLMLTALHESKGGRYLKQVGGGPALGIFQMEPPTHDDIHKNFLAHRPRLQEIVFAVAGGRRTHPPSPSLLTYNLRYAAAMARVHYFRSPKPLPAADTGIKGLADYWKAVYNTDLGKGTPEKAIADALAAFQELDNDRVW